MKRFTLSVLFVLFAAVSTSARADVFTQLLVEGSVKLVGAAIKGTVNAVKDVVVPKETAEERLARRQEEIEQKAEQILEQYPADQRDAMRSQTIERLAMTQAQYEAMEARQKAIVAEQNSLGNVVAGAATSAVASTIGNRTAIDAAARSASYRIRF